MKKPLLNGAEIESLKLNSKLIPIPMSDEKEDGRYFLINHRDKDDIEIIEYVRIGEEINSYTKMQIKRKSYEIRKHSTEDYDSLESSSFGDWHIPNENFTDQDIFNFICKHTK